MRRKAPMFFLSRNLKARLTSQSAWKKPMAPAAGACTARPPGCPYRPAPAPPGSTLGCLGHACPGPAPRPRRRPAAARRRPPPLMDAGPAPPRRGAGARPVLRVLRCFREEAPLTSPAASSLPLPALSPPAGCLFSADGGPLRPRRRRAGRRVGGGAGGGVSEGGPGQCRAGGRSGAGRDWGEGGEEAEAGAPVHPFRVGPRALSKLSGTVNSGTRGPISTIGAREREIYIYYICSSQPG